MSAIDVLKAMIEVLDQEITPCCKQVGATQYAFGNQPTEVTTV